MAPKIDALRFASIQELEWARTRCGLMVVGALLLIVVMALISLGMGAWHQAVGLMAAFALAVWACWFTVQAIVAQQELENRK